MDVCVNWSIFTLLQCLCPKWLISNYLFFLESLLCYRPVLHILQWDTGNYSITSRLVDSLRKEKTVQSSIHFHFLMSLHYSCKWKIKENKTKAFSRNTSILMEDIWLNHLVFLKTLLCSLSDVISTFLIYHHQLVYSNL